MSTTTTTTTTSVNTADNATAEAFRAKVQSMRAWEPLNTPSNRDRLELYALHKQAVSGDAPNNYDTSSNSSSSSVADRAKLTAWKNKRGLTQEAAMNAYVAECDRQQRVYGTDPGQTPQSTPMQEDDTTTATNNNEDDEPTGGSTLLTPRGLAAVPLLCAAAAENRMSYLSRLKSTGQPENGWWTKQEPLCGDPGSILAMPESLLLWLATRMEFFSLQQSDNIAGILPASVLQSFLWPTHNVLLAIWIVLIFVFCVGTASGQALATVVLGSRRTGIRLSQIFREEIVPSSRTASTLCEPHQAISIRLVGLALMPLVTICDLSQSLSSHWGLLTGAVLFILSSLTTWWYWLLTLPALVCTSVVFSFFTLGWCFAIIELARATTNTSSVR